MYSYSSVLSFCSSLIIFSHNSCSRSHSLPERSTSCFTVNNSRLGVFRALYYILCYVHVFFFLYMASLSDTLLTVHRPQSKENRLLGWGHSLNVRSRSAACWHAPVFCHNSSASFIKLGHSLIKTIVKKSFH